MMMLHTHDTWLQQSHFYKCTVQLIGHIQFQKILLGHSCKLQREMFVEKITYTYLLKCGFVS